MNKAQLVSLVEKLSLISGTTLHNVDEANVASLETMLVHQVEKLEERMAQQDNADLTNYQQALSQLADANVKLELFQSIENENVTAMLKFVTAKEERVSELEKLVKLQSERIAESDAEVKGLVQTVDKLTGELKEWEKAKRIAEALQRGNGNGGGGQQQEERTPRPDVPQDTKTNVSVLAHRLRITPRDNMWNHITVRRDQNRFTLFFSGEFYEENKNACFGFLGRIRVRAVAEGHKSWFDKHGYLVIVTKPEPAVPPQTTEI